MLNFIHHVVHGSDKVAEVKPVQWADDLIN